MMVIDNISMILSIFTLLFAIVNAILIFKKQKIDKFPYYNKIIRSKRNLSIKNNNKDITEKMCLEKLLEDICIIYPKTKLDATIKIVLDTDNQNKKVIDWVSKSNYNNKDNTKKISSIVDREDLYSIFDKKNEFFFVGDIKEYNMLNSKNINYEKRFNSLITFPLYKKEKREIIGFICISSPQKMKNVKRNEFIINHVKKYSKFISELITKNLNSNNYGKRKDITIFKDSMLESNIYQK